MEHQRLPHTGDWPVLPHLQAKAGLIDKKHCHRLTKISAWTECIGYFGSVSLSLLAISASVPREAELLKELREQGTLKFDGWNEDDVRLKELKQLRVKRFMNTLALIQDAADALLALDDILERKSVLKNPVLLSLAGLLSALISAYKNWPA
jgi:predicted tellurium resistance membrane protein TerC